MKIHLFFSSVIIAALSSVTPTFVSGAEFTQGIARVSGQLTNGATVQVEIRTMKLTNQYSYTHAFMWGGDIKGPREVIMPKNVIAAMDVQIGKERVLIDRKSTRLNSSHHS